ncbi:MAG: farnesyl diphosphate synthase [Pseudomonadota bacterium]|nr:farnesyl diphosphate synthase [Pseudomonadota bacterium]
MTIDSPLNERFLRELDHCSKVTKNKLRKVCSLRDDSPLSEAIKYAVLGGGKGLRSFLAIKSAEIFDVPYSQAVQCAAAIECIHSYSLVHDDLPAMDNDDLRRGKPTVHKKWDEATAILVGDGLQALAFEVLSQRETHHDPEIRLNLVNSLSIASGILGMVGGQALDIHAEKSKASLNLTSIKKMQSLKTGALFIWATEVGPRLSRNDIRPFTNFARYLGLAFQIQDDILDITGKAEETGKALRKDVKAGKATFVSILGLSGAKKEARLLIEQANKQIEKYGEKAEMLRALAKFSIERKF